MHRQENFARSTASRQGGRESSVTGNIISVHAHKQVSLSQRESLSAAGSGASLLQELTSFLRRSLSQQAPVRAALYQASTPLLDRSAAC